MYRRHVIFSFAFLLLAGGTQPGLAKTFDDCLAQVQRDPDGYEPFQCLWIVAQDLNRYEDALVLVERHLEVDARQPWAVLQQVKLKWVLDRPSAAEEFWRLAERYRGSEDGHRVVDALIGVSSTLRNRGELADARAVLARAEDYALEISELAVARVRMFLGRAVEQQGDYSAARGLYESARAAVDAQGNLGDRALLWAGYGNLAYRLGEHERALDAYGRAAEAYRELGHVKNRLAQELNQLFCLAGLSNQGEVPREEVLGRAEALADDAEQHDLPRYALAAYQVLTDFSEPAAAIGFAERALRATERMEDAWRRIGAMESYGSLLVEHGGPREQGRGFTLIRDAIRLAEGHGALPYTAQLHRTLADLARRHSSREEAIAASLAALDVFESIRNAQLDEDLRQRAFGYAMTAFAQLQEYLLVEPWTRPGEEDFDLAFRTSERARVRTLLDFLESAGAYGELAEDDPLVIRRASVLRDITEHQKRLGEPLSDDDRAAALEALLPLELEERRLRTRLAERYEIFRPLESFEIPTLEEVRGALEPDEAIVSFQATAPGVLSGLVVVHTSAASWARTLGDLEDLPQLVRLLRGLIERRDGSERLLAGKLYDLLLADALEDLPDSVDRLIIVPDGVLHRLPFDVLQRASAAPPLLVEFEIVVVPSVTLWHRWRGASQPKPERSLLALAAPRLSADATDDDDDRSPGAMRMGFEDLPFAAEEARRIVRKVGGECRVGDRATEAHLKSAELDRYGVLHLAAHGVVDERHPDRSAILLAPGNTDEDGLLQPRDVLGLPLAGRMVVLSACRTAAGRIVDGEGVLGLVRGFFQAGAHAVVGSLWSVQDEETARLIESFYDHLSRGETASQALTLAKRARRTAGEPAAAWAALVLNGRGEILPLADARPATRSSQPWLVGGAAFLVLAGALWFKLRAG